MERSNHLRQLITLQEKLELSQNESGALQNNYYIEMAKHQTEVKNITTELSKMQRESSAE